MTTDPHAPPLPFADLLREGQRVRLSDIGLEARITPAPSSNRKERMATHNPYERRGRENEHRSGEIRGTMTFGQPESPPSARLRADDLDALMARAYERGVADATERLRREHDDDRRRIGREAWDDGQTAGRAALHEAYEARFGARVHKLHERLDAIVGLDDPNDDKKPVKRVDLLRWLRRSIDLLEELVEGHRELGEGSESPF